MFTHTSLIIAIIVLAVGSAWSIFKNKLTRLAGLSAFLVGLAIYICDGWSGLAILAAFFIMATLATSHKKEKKATLEAKQRHPEKRKAGQVFANGGIAALSGIMVLFFPSYDVMFALMMASAISAATADTLASELGMVYGRNAINILTFKREAKGLDGVVSAEGTLLGLIGSCIIGLIYCTFHSFHVDIFLIIVVAGTLGNLVDSLLGALLERKRIIGNNVVNLLNTITGALVAMVACMLLLR